MAEWQPTACILCECNCGVEVRLEGPRIAKVRGDKAHPVSRGYACEKAQQLDHYQNGPDRVLRPLRRKPDGTFEQVDWDTAIREVAQGFGAVRAAHGGESIIYYGGGGQGNHLCGAYAIATRRAIGARYRSSALAQEKTGEFWVNERMLGAHTRADFEHCDVGLFLGKNPWFSHGIPRARVTLKALAKDPARTLIVVDPRRTKTAALADIHLQVRPGCDAWLLTAMVALLLREGAVDHAFVDAHTDGFEAVEAAFADVDVAQHCAWAGVPEAQVRAAVAAIRGAERFASFEDLGVQMNRHSTVVSYLHKLLWLLTGHVGRPGTATDTVPLVPFADGRYRKDTPVTGAKIIGGMVPCNAIAEEILADHPKRFRAMLVEGANPAHSLADSPRFAQALDRLDFLVVVDVALTETARHAHYVLPATTQYEKAEATFFNFEFPENAFHLRKAILPAPEGPLPEAEIHSRLVEAIGALDAAPLDALRDSAAQGLMAYAMAFAQKVATQPALLPYAPVILYRTLGPSLPEAAAEGAVVFGLCLQAAMRAPKDLARAGFAGPPLQAAVALFQRIIDSPSGVVFSVGDWADVLKRFSRPIHLDLPDLLADARALADGPPPADPDFPFVLAAGERRAFTANTIFRDPDWRTKDPAGALRLNPSDGAALGLVTGDTACVTTRRGQVWVAVELSDTMLPGHASIPNGMGLAGGVPAHGGVPTNALTRNEDRDPYAGTPHHKYVPARIERATPQEPLHV